MQQGQLWINGQWINGQGSPFQSINPSNNEVIWEGCAAAPEQIAQAIQAARQAFNPWHKTPLEKRIQYCQKMRDLIVNQQDNLSLAIAMEMGKPLWEANTEVSAMITKVESAIIAYRERTGFSEKLLANNVQLKIQHKAHGVIAIFSPFNFPAHIAHGQIVSTLLAGNTLILKPSDLTPKVAELMMHLWQQTGIPDGVINLTQGGVNTGQALASHYDLNGLFFTGSYTVGRELHRQFAGHPNKLLVLEMGGNNPLIVGEVNDLPSAAYTTIQSAYITSGQRCSCARRLLVPDTTQGNYFIEALLEMIKTIAVNASDHQPPPFMGPMVSRKAATKIMETQAQWKQQGAKAFVSSIQPDPHYAFVTPGLIDMTTVQNPDDTECFGPLLQVYRYQQFEEAIQLANQTQYGLSAGVLSDNPQHYDRFLMESRAGLVNWNRPLSGASSEAPFGGIGFSGNFHPCGYYTADACAYPVSSMMSKNLTLPETLTPGIAFEN